MTAFLLKKNCMALWTGNDTVADSSGNSLDATAVGTVSYASALFGSGFNFDGAGNFYLDATNDASIDFGTEDFTILSTFNINNFSATQYLFDKGTGSLIDGYGGLVFTDKTLRFITDGDDGVGGNKILTSQTLLEANTDYMVAFVRRSGIKELWINAVQDTNTQAETRELSNLSEKLYLGRASYDGNASYFNGVLSQVAIFDVALTSGQIAQAYSDQRVVLAPVWPTIVGLQGFLYDKEAVVASDIVWVRPYQAGFMIGDIWQKYVWKNMGTTDATDGIFSIDLPMNPMGKYWEIKFGDSSKRYKLGLTDTDDLHLSDVPTFELIEDD